MYICIKRKLTGNNPKDHDATAPADLDIEAHFEFEPCRSRLTLTGAKLMTD